MWEPGTRPVKVPPKGHMEKLRRRLDLALERRDILGYLKPKDGVAGSKGAMKRLREEYEPGEVEEFVTQLDTLLGNVERVVGALEDAPVGDPALPMMVALNQVAGMIERNEGRKREDFVKLARSVTGDVIEWWDRPEENARIYRHVGCDETDINGGWWVVPLDDTPGPKRHVEECARCAHVLPLLPLPEPGPGVEHMRGVIHLRAAERRRVREADAKLREREWLLEEHQRNVRDQGLCGALAPNGYTLCALRRGHPEVEHECIEALGRHAKWRGDHSLDPDEPLFATPELDPPLREGT